MAKWENFVKTTLSSNVSIGATTIIVVAATSPFNTPIDPSGDTAKLVLTNSESSPTKFEVVSYTGRTGTGPYTLTGVLKGLEDTSDQAWVTGNIIQQADTKTDHETALKTNETATLSAGYSATPDNAGTKSSGTFTPDEADGNFQYAVNGGAHALAPPINNCTILIQYTNNASAGIITTSGFTIVTGDSITTTNGDDFIFNIAKINGFSHLNVVALP